MYKVILSLITCNSETTGNSFKEVKWKLNDLFIILNKLNISPLLWNEIKFLFFYKALMDILYINYYYLW